MNELNNLMEWKCPYCEHVNSIHHTFDSWKKSTIERCDIEDGGCDCRVVIDWALTAHLTVFEIEGEEVPESQDPRDMGWVDDRGRP